MKNIIQFSTLILTLFFFSSCEEDLIIFDVDNGQTLASFVTEDMVLPVSDTGSSIELQVGVTTISDRDRAITLSIDPASTAGSEEYTIDQSTLIIPAGEFIGNVVVNGNFDAIPAVGSTAVILNLDSVEGADVLEGTLTNQVEFFRFCPFENGADFLGEYELETQIEGIFSSPTLADGTITISEGETVADREFEITPYPQLGSFRPFIFRFSLICDEIVVSLIDNIGIGCSGGNGIGPSATVTSSYLGGDDSELVINFIDDIRGQCDGPHEVQIILTKL